MGNEKATPSKFVYPLMLLTEIRGAKTWKGAEFSHCMILNQSPLFFEKNRHWNAQIEQDKVPFIDVLCSAAEFS